MGISIDTDRIPAQALHLSESLGLSFFTWHVWPHNIACFFVSEAPVKKTGHVCSLDCCCRQVRYKFWIFSSYRIRENWWKTSKLQSTKCQICPKIGLKKWEWSGTRATKRIEV